VTLEEFQKLKLPVSLRTTVESDLDLMPDLVTFPAGTHVYVKRAVDTDSIRYIDPSPDMVAFSICEGWSYRSRGTRSPPPERQLRH
jgi:hypothetical protein